MIMNDFLKEFLDKSISMYYNKITTQFVVLYLSHRGLIHFLHL